MAHKTGGISGGIAIYLALLMLIFPLRWLVAMVFAAAVHECGHFLAVRLCGGKVSSFRIAVFGASMSTAHMTPVQEMICVLAGPLAGAMLFLLVRFFPRLAVCGLLQSVYNLLPVFPLDGGRVLRCILDRVGCPLKLRGFIETVLTALLAALGIYAAVVLHLGWLSVLIILLPVRCGLEKYLAIRNHLRYNNIVQH